MPRKRSLVLCCALMIVVLVMVACDTANIFNTSGTPYPTRTSRPAVPVIHHDPPALTVDVTPFEALNCNQEYEDYWVCTDSPEAMALGCQVLYGPDDMLGGFEPRDPVILCRSEFDPMAERLEREEYLYDIGCPVPMYMHLLIQRDGEFKVLHDQAELRDAFAPIDSPEEALSFAMIATGYYPIYNMEAPRSYRYNVGELEDTHVEKTDAGFVVHLFDYQFCGCGNHYTYSVAVTVAVDGTWTEGEHVKLYRDPKTDDLCQD